jgi:dephospho-CoA kinase
MARGTLTEDQFQTILARQMPDSEKRARATHIVETLSLDSTRAYVRALITHIREGRRHA